MYFYYFRELKDSKGYGTIRVAKIIWHQCAMEKVYGWTDSGKWGETYRIRYEMYMKIDPKEFELPQHKWRAQWWKETNRYYNTVRMPFYDGEKLLEGTIVNRTFWLRDYDPERAQKIVNDYYEEKMQKEIRKYTKRMNSTIEVLTKAES